MSKPIAFDPLLLDRFLTGEATDAERTQVEVWIAADIRNAAILETLRSTFTAQRHASETATSWQQLAARIDRAGDGAPLRVMPRSTPRRGQSSVSHPRWFRQGWRAAAALLILVGGTRAWQLQRDRLHVVQAPRGERASVVLPDGSKLMLAAGSSAHWRGSFTHGPREITLDGEGYFDVIHDTARQFRVRARHAVVEDVGTRFVVRAWPELGRVEVALEQGAATLADSARSRTAHGTLLRAGQLGRLDGSGHVEVTDRASAVLAWTHGNLVFDDTPLSEALPALSRWYGVELHADAALQSHHLTAQFAPQPLPRLLDALAVALNARVVRDPALPNSISLVPVRQ
ncbi:MAG: FecR domain-containing protein [bacterium]